MIGICVRMASNQWLYVGREGGMTGICVRMASNQWLYVGTERGRDDWNMCADGK